MARANEWTEASYGIFTPWNLAAGSWAERFGRSLAECHGAEVTEFCERETVKFGHMAEYKDS